MITIIFEAHGTTFDNEAKLASGFNDIALSPLGEQQSKEMGKRHENENFDAIFCSDLQRSYKSAEIAFGDKYPIIKDSRLRECDYGDLTQKPRIEVEAEKIARIHIPFPNGESYEQTTTRMKDFLNSLFEKYNGKKILIIGHRATQYGLDNLINGIPLHQLVSAKFVWQPGWRYELKKKLEENLQKTGVIFALIRGTEILMQQRDGDCKKFPFMWCLPGGTSDRNENYEATLLREIKEEYDLNIKLEQCTYLMDYNNGLDKVYICKVNLSQEPKLTEGLAMKWMEIDEIEKLELGFHQEGIIPVLKIAVSRA